MKNFLFQLGMLCVLLSNVISLGFGQVQAWETPPKLSKWFQLEAGHFTIWYEEHNEEIALEYASYGEAFYKDYSEVFQYEPGKVYIKIDGRLHVVNGQYIPSPPIISMYPTSAKMDSKGYNWNYYLLAHEFVHYIHLQYDNSFAGVLIKLIGPAGRWVMLANPLWAAEGLATIIESDITSHGRANNPVFLMPMRADVLLQNRDKFLQSTLVNVDDAITSYGRQYSYGTALMGYIKEKYGYQKITEIWRNFAKFPLGYSARHKKIIGKSLYELHDEMLDDLEQKYAEYKDWPRGRELPDKDSSGIRYSVLNESEKGILLYKSGVNVRPQFVLYSPKDDSMTNLFTQARSGVSFFAPLSGYISKDGNFVVYHAPVENTSIQTEGGHSGGVLNDLFLFDTNTKRHRRLTRKQNLSAPILDPDNTHVYASQSTSGGVYSRLVRFSVENPREGFEVIYETPESNIAFKKISPDGTKIIFEERGRNIGIQLQILDLKTKQIKTLIQRDYGLMFVALDFIDNNTIFLAGDIERAGMMTEMYKVEIEENKWTRIARDKVGLSGAILSTTGKAIYTSDNSEGQSIYIYETSELDNTTIDIASIAVPSYFHENNLQRYLNETTIANPDTALQNTKPVPISDLKYTKRRIHPAVPSRFDFAIPFASFGISETGTYFNLGYNFRFAGKTRTSALGLFMAVQMGTWQPIYTLQYDVAISPVGLFSLSTKRNHTYDNALEEYAVSYNHLLKMKRPLVSSAKGHALSMELSSALNHSNSSEEVVLLESAFGSDFVDTAYMETEYSLILPLKWSDGTYTSFNTPLSWNITPGVYYRPPVLNVEENEVQGIIDGYVQVPFTRLSAFKLSMYNSFSNIDDYGVRVETERYARTSGLDIIPGTGDLTGGTGSVETELRSSVALDLLLNFGSYEIGSYLTHLSTAYVDMFLEQSMGYSIQQAEFGINEYIITGMETGVTLYFLGGVPVNLKMGAAFKMPYQEYVDFDYKVYFSFGGRINTTSGIGVF